MSRADKAKAAAKRIAISAVKHATTDAHVMAYVTKAPTHPGSKAHRYARVVLLLEEALDAIEMGDLT